MNMVLRRFRDFLVSEDGPTATEYAVMLALIIVVSVATIQTLGQSVNQTFSDVNDAIAGGG